ncbi:hypothetical protein B0T25DRAFT_563050 [Lasiosphaeria hispida]|uniref:Uncharacterized protein n=1 Tax=Lasiosphaeria hispida TaxID=260671 RepID=A0AAJ0HWT1_9PEZI|nr:hypothetical protein B0T25DRAFT_563050 [Lasiosphaeria hispida]
MNHNGDDDIELGFQRGVERDSESANFWSPAQRNCFVNSFILFLLVILYMVLFIVNMIGCFFRLTLNGKSFIPGLALAIKKLLCGLALMIKKLLHGLAYTIKKLLHGLIQLCWAALVLLAIFLAIFLIVLYSIAPKDRLRLIISIFNSTHTTTSPM